MNKHQQSGMTTLLITSMLLIVALLFSLASYKNLFYQIKRTQNEVLARQAHWIAEGGLECGFTEYKINKNNFTDFDECNTAELELTLTPVTSTEFHLESKVTNFLQSKKIFKNIKLGGSGKSGAMRSSADLYFYGSVSFMTPDPGNLEADGWQCVALRYRSRFYAAVIDSKGIYPGGELPFNDFDPLGNKCAPNHFNIFDHDDDGIINGDFVKDSSVSPFEEIFGVEKINHNEVRDSGEFELLTTNGFNRGNCGDLIVDILKHPSKKERIWIEGDCEIKSSAFEDLINESEKTQGILLVFHDGLLSFMDPSLPPPPPEKAKGLKGMIVHFNYDYSIGDTSWVGLDANITLGNSSSIFPSDYLSISSYYQKGSFIFSGGQVFDSVGHSALFYGAIDFRYNKDVINSALSVFNQPRWQEGSWHDFEYQKNNRL
ncbi:hypothetical protein [uncultured Photobacterium sp.]|uniref:hypothetical protein n=1 Tax=uncultured Photobacterium sp. TaxID=173973 RepID=UPI002603485E|nr:hypothetical protein [uncultured Photobacterium sp.]